MREKKEDGCKYLKINIFLSFVICFKERKKVEGEKNSKQNGWRLTPTENSGC